MIFTKKVKKKMFSLPSLQCNLHVHVAEFFKITFFCHPCQTIVGGVSSCGDFGIYNFENFWMYYKGKNWTCTKGVDSSLPIQTGLWYLVAVTNNGTHVTGYANNQSSTVEVRGLFTRELNYF